MAHVALTDIHGRFDLLEAMNAKLEETLPPGDNTLVLCGDYMDRGPQSKEVMNALMAGTTYFTWAKEIVKLKGNHEDIFWYAIELGNWDMLLNNGGYATLKSLLEVSTDAQVNQAIWPHDGGLPTVKDHPNVQKVMEFMKDLKLIHQAGKYIFVHAGMNPYIEANKQLADQKRFEELFMWVREMWLRANVDLGYTVVHGHTPHSHDTYRHAADYRINLDSGACWTGVLTGLIIHDINDRKAHEIVTAENTNRKRMYFTDD